MEDKAFDREKTELNGSKYLTGNGYMGYRGTLEEYTREQLVSCILSGVYDRAGEGWREPVNAPNGFYTRLFCDGTLLSVLACDPVEHEQGIDLFNGIHRRKTVFRMPGRGLLQLESERFISLDRIHLMCMKYSFRSDRDCEIVIETGIDADVWDINGPHLKNLQAGNEDSFIFLTARTQELNYTVAVSESADLRSADRNLLAAPDTIMFSADQTLYAPDRAVLRKITLHARANVEYTLTKYVSVFTSLDISETDFPETPYPGRNAVSADGAQNTAGETGCISGTQSEVCRAAVECCRSAADAGYGDLLQNHCNKWKARWDRSDVLIEGDEEAQIALRFSIYQLLAIAPAHSGNVSIPARGLSGQVYKGAVFWDTEMFMLPFFIYTNPDIARNLMKYRCVTLDGARRKAAEYGFRGAFYAWESQDTGDDACTHFNVTDVFTGRPMRTYFRDKQIHISADVVYGIWNYYRLTGDEGLLMDGGIETILECARFLYSYSYFKKDKKRYELPDVTGPDEYHERVNNNAFTNAMAKYTLETALEALKLLREKYPERYDALVEKLDYEADLDNIREMNELLYVPGPDPESLVIEQFDGYHRLEDVGLQELKGRILDRNEYLGGGNGLATTSKIIKQADVVLMLNLFKERFSQKVKKANWAYYEPRTEHGSSLSPCVYAMLAADNGAAEWGYPYFMKTATIDMTGKSKQYVGTLYIGGTHPAANGGAWMSAVLGFGGLSADESGVRLKPNLPSKWKSLQFRIIWRNQKLCLKITHDTVIIRSDPQNSTTCSFNINGRTVLCGIGCEIRAAY